MNTNITAQEINETSLLKYIVIPTDRGLLYEEDIKEFEILSDAVKYAEEHKDCQHFMPLIIRGYILKPATQQSLDKGEDK